MKKQRNRPGILLIGTGNQDRRDDGAGLAVALNIRRIHPVEVVEAHGDLLDLIELWEGTWMTIIVDAASSGKTPGSVTRFDAVGSPLPGGFPDHSTHGFGLQTVIELARELDRLPERLIVFAIEGRDFSPGRGFSDEASAGIESCTRLVSAEIHSAGLRRANDIGRDAIK